MRRLLCVTVVSGVMLLGAGCSSDDPAGPAAAPATSASAPVSAAASVAADPAPASGDVALAGNSEAICRQAGRAGDDAAQRFAEDLKLRIDAESAQSPDQVAQARAKTARDVQNYSSALTDMAKLASEPALKAALADLGKRVTALGGDVLKIDAAQLTKLREALDKACGAG